MPQNKSSNTKSSRNNTKSSRNNTKSSRNNTKSSRNNTKSSRNNTKSSRNNIKSRGSKPAWQKEIVKERIQILFKQAEESFSDSPERSKRYVEMALKLSMRYNVRLNPDFKRKFCRNCHSLFRTVNSRARTSTNQAAVTLTCKECGHVNRFSYRKEKQKLRK